MAEVSKEELRRRIHVVLQTWTDEQDAGKPTFDPYDQWAACIEVLQSVEPLLARMAGPQEVVVKREFFLRLVGLAEHAQTYARNFGDFEILADADKAIAEYETLAQGGTDDRV